MHLHQELAHQHQAELRREAQDARLLSRGIEVQGRHRAGGIVERLFGRRAARTPRPLRIT